MSEPDTPTDANVAAGFKLVEGLDAMIAAAAGVKAHCVARGFTAESGEAVAVELMVGFIRQALPARKSSSFLDALAGRGR